MSTYHLTKECYAVPPPSVQRVCWWCRVHRWELLIPIIIVVMTGKTVDRSTCKRCGEEAPCGKEDCEIYLQQASRTRGKERRRASAEPKVKVVEMREETTAAPGEDHSELVEQIRPSFSHPIIPLVNLLKRTQRVYHHHRAITISSNGTKLTRGNLRGGSQGIMTDTMELCNPPPPLWKR